MHNAFLTPIELPRERFDLTHTQRVMSLGSCFSEHIARRLEEYKFRTDINPFGVLYNPMSIVEALRRLMTGEPYTEESPELVEHEGRWHSLMHHSDFSAGSREELLSRLNTRLEHSAGFLRQTDVLLITFGSAYVYRYKADGRIAGNCHKLPDRLFIRERLTPDGIVEECADLLAALQDINPNLRIIFTVSPIRHRREGMHGNQVSKSVLLLAVEELCTRFSGVCYYFPAYEIMMDELRDYRFYADDMLHPSPVAIDHIWGYFTDHFFSPREKNFFQTWEEIRKGLAHRPLNPGSEAHKQFLSQLALRITRLKEKCPTFDVEKELAQCHIQLNK